MAVVSVGFDGTRVDAADSVGTVWVAAGGATPAAETDFSYQNATSMSAQVKTSESGFGYFNNTTTRDMTTPQVWIAKAWNTNYGILDGTGFVLEIGSGASARLNYYRYYIYTASTYPIAGGWLIVPIDPNVAAYRNAAVNTPALNTVSFFGIRSDFSAQSKTANVGLDAIDIIPSGTGLTLTGGDSTDADGTFDSFINYDEGTSTNRYGIVATKEGILYVTGTLTIGSAVSAAGFTDTNKTLVFPGGRFDTGFCGIKLDLTQANTDINMTSCTFNGRGRRGYADFDSTGDIAAATDIITTNQNHNFVTGDAATYSKNGGTAATGLTDSTVYYINRISDTTLYAYDTITNALAGGATGRVDLSAAGAETHTFTRTTDTRPNLTLTGTGGDADIDACAFSSFNSITLTSVTSLTDTTVNDCQSLTQSSATIDNCTFNTPPLAAGTAFLTSNNPAVITNCTFIKGTFGHAIELNGSTAGNTYTFDGNTFTGYGPTVFGFHTTNDVNATTDVVTSTAHGYSTGDRIHYRKQGGSVNMGLTDNTVYYVRAVSADTIAFYASENNATSDSSRIALTSTGSETHYINSMNAAIYNNSGGAVTLNLTNTNSVPTIRNGSGASTTVNNNVNFTVTVQDASADAIVGAQVAIFKTSDDSVILASTGTGATGTVTGQVARNTGAIYIRVRQSTNYATFSTAQAFTSEELNTDANHSFVSGEAVVYDKNGGTAAIGLTDGTTYYVNAVDANTVTMHLTAAAAIAGTGDIDLTTNGSETHRLDPIRYVNNSTVGTIGTTNFAVTITMIQDTTAGN